MDVKRVTDLSAERQALLERFKEEDITVVEMSTMTEEGVMKVKQEVSSVQV